MNALVAEVERRFRGYFEQLANELRQLHPLYKFNVYDGQVGSLTAFQGYDLGIEALISGTEPNYPESIAFSIMLCHLTTEPRVMLDVSWGHGAGGGCRSLWSAHSIEFWPLASDKRLDEAFDHLPELADWFAQEIKRRRPTV